MNEISALLLKYRHQFHPVVPLDADAERIILLDMTANNPELSPDIVNDINHFTSYIDKKRAENFARYAIGGYGEHRTIYSRSSVFDGDVEPRRFHLGLDIWGDDGTPVTTPLDAQVHSFAYNDRYGDYGATIILRHELEGIVFYSLYGHLSLADLELEIGMALPKGTVFAHFGKPTENGCWPPHLHMQLIRDIGNHKGDYPGVCRYSERNIYLDNCPDPDLICRLYRYV